jgi:hypothetical protein
MIRKKTKTKLKLNELPYDQQLPRRRDLAYLKPPKFKQYVTIRELSDIVEKDISWIRKLERDNRIPKASRVKRGRLEVRMWSPEQVDEIERIIAGHHKGRPRGS